MDKNNNFESENYDNFSPDSTEDQPNSTEDQSEDNFLTDNDNSSESIAKNKVLKRKNKQKKKKKNSEELAAKSENPEDIEDKISINNKDPSYSDLELYGDRIRKRNQVDAKFDNNNYLKESLSQSLDEKPANEISNFHQLGENGDTEFYKDSYENYVKERRSNDDEPDGVNEPEKDSNYQLRANKLSRLKRMKSSQKGSASLNTISDNDFPNIQTDNRKENIEFDYNKNTEFFQDSYENYAKAKLLESSDENITESFETEKNLNSDYENDSKREAKPLEDRQNLDDLSETPFDEGSFDLIGDSSIKDINYKKRITTPLRKRNEKLLNSKNTSSSSEVNDLEYDVDVYENNYVLDKIKDSGFYSSSYENHNEPKIVDLSNQNTDESFESEKNFNDRYENNNDFKTDNNKFDNDKDSSFKNSNASLREKVKKEFYSQGKNFSTVLNKRKNNKESLKNKFYADPDHMGFEPEVQGGEEKDIIISENISQNEKLKEFYSKRSFEANKSEFEKESSIKDELIDGLNSKQSKFDNYNSDNNELFSEIENQNKDISQSKFSKGKRFNNIDSADSDIDTFKNFEHSSVFEDESIIVSENIFSDNNLDQKQVNIIAGNVKNSEDHINYTNDNTFDDIENEITSEKPISGEYYVEKDGFGSEDKKFIDSYINETNENESSIKTSDGKLKKSKIVCKMEDLNSDDVNDVQNKDGDLEKVHSEKRYSQEFNFKHDLPDYNVHKHSDIYKPIVLANRVSDIVDSDDTIGEDIEKNTEKEIIDLAQKSAKEKIYESIVTDKIKSDISKNASKEANTSATSNSNKDIDRIAKNYRKKKQYEESMRLSQRLSNIIRNKASKAAAGSGASKGALILISAPSAPVIAIVAIVFLIIVFLWAAILMVVGISNTLSTTTYMTTNKEITACTSYYSELEADFLADVNKKIEDLNEDEDIARVDTDFDSIEHNPEQLICYLSALYPGFDFNGGVVEYLISKITGLPYTGNMKDVINELFEYQYSSEVKYTYETIGSGDNAKTITIATVYIHNNGFNNTIEKFLEALSSNDEYDEEDVEEIKIHYQQLMEYRGNHGFWLDTPVDYDWRNYVVGLYGYETEDGGITSVSAGELLSNTNAGIEVTDEDLSHYDQTALGMFTTTGYCTCKICCGPYSPEVTGNPPKTKSGTTPVAGRTVAVDPKKIPLGSKLLINGHIYTAEDTGGAIKGNKIDIFYNTHQEAFNHGKQTNVPVFLLTPKSDDGNISNIAPTNDLVSIALSELEDGVRGVPNKYTEWYGEIRGSLLYNWCAAFVSYCIDKADMTSVVPKTAEVSVLMENAKEAGIWQGKTGYVPVPGDIMIQKSYNASHTGIVVESTDTYFDTVEGNSGSYSLSRSKVGRYRYYYDDSDYKYVTGFIKTGGNSNIGGSLYYKFTNYAKGTDIQKHKGMDIAGDSNTSVLSVISGKVTKVTSDGLTLKNDMYEVKYSSLKNITVNKGDEIESGISIASMSDSENRGVPYVHIEVISIDGNEEMDPFIYCNIGEGTAPDVHLAGTLVSVGIGTGSVSAEFGNIHAPYTDEFASRAVVTSAFFDSYHSSFHRAIDLDVTYGTNVGIAAAWDGKVVLIGSGNGNGLTGYGYVIVLEHNINGVKVYSKYNHLKMNSSTLKVGDVVAAGQQIAIQGATGNVSGEHLDFQIGICSNSYNWSEFSNNLINPIAIYQGWSQSINTISIWNSNGGCVRQGDDYNQTRLIDNMQGKHIF